MQKPALSLASIGEIKDPAERARAAEEYRRYTVFMGDAAREIRDRAVATLKASGLKRPAIVEATGINEHTVRSLTR